MKNRVNAAVAMGPEALAGFHFGGVDFLGSHAVVFPVVHCIELAAFDLAPIVVVVIGRGLWLTLLLGPSSLD